MIEEYQKGEQQSEYDLTEPSVSEVVQSLFQKQIENNTYDKNQSQRFKHHNLQQNHSLLAGNQKQKEKNIFQRLISVTPLNSWSNGQKEDLNNDKQKQYQKEFSQLVDSDIDTNKFNSWTQERELNQVLKELSQEPNDFFSAFGDNIESKVKAILNGDHLKSTKAQNEQSSDQNLANKQLKENNQQSQAQTINNESQWSQDWYSIKQQAWSILATGLTYFQPLSAMTAFTANQTYDFIKYSIDAGKNKLRQVKHQYEISDIGFILLFAVLIAMLFVICCIFMCMGKMCIAVTICLIALIIVVIAALMWTNRESYKHQKNDSHNNTEEID